MPPEATAQRIVTDFGKLIAAVVLHNDAVAQQTGMSATESQSLHLVQLHGELTPSELARRTGLSSGTVTGVLDRLEKLGLVRRDRHPEDRRKVLVRVDQARLDEAFGAMYAEQRKLLSAVVDSLSDRERAAVAKFLAALVAE